MTEVVRVRIAESDFAGFMESTLPARERPREGTAQALYRKLEYPLGSLSMSQPL